MEGPPLGPGGEDITWPDQVAPRGRKASSTRKVKPQTSNRMHALGTGYAKKSGEPLGFRPKEETCASTGAHPPGMTSTSHWRRLALPVLPRAALFGGHQSDLAGCKSPPLFKRGASSFPSQRQHQREPWGASPRPSAPTYLPTHLGR